MKAQEFIDELITEANRKLKKAQENGDYDFRDYLEFHIKDLEKLKRLLK